MSTAVRSFRVSAAPLAALLLLPAAAPEPPRPFAERSDVTLVEVPVVVTGRDGAAIRGLTVSDFELFDEGVPQAIEALDVADLGRFRESGEEEAWHLPAAGRRHFLFLFDLSHCSTGSLERARADAARFVRQALAPEDLGAVASISIERGLALHVTFSADRPLIARAIESVGLPSSFPVPDDSLSFTIRPPVDTGTSNGVPAPTAGADLIQPSIVLQQKGMDEYAADQVGRMISSMSVLGEALDAVAGRKTVLFFSEGFDGRYLVGETDKESERMLVENDAIVRGELWNVNVERRFGNRRFQDVFERTMALFRRSDSAIFPIDIGGLRVREKEGVAASRYRREALDAIAQATQGESVHGENDIGRALERVRERTSLTYVLFFRPSRTTGEGAYHRLKVRVRRAGARVTARAGYYERRGFSKRSPLARALAAADAIAQERPAEDFPVRLLAWSLPSAEGFRVPVVVEVSGEPLLAARSGKKLRLGLYLYAVTEQGEVRDYRTRSFSLDLERESPRLEKGPLRYDAVLKLPEGRYRIRALVRDEDAGRAGFRAASLEVPGAAAGESLLSAPPLFVAAEGGVSLRDRDSAGASAPEPLELAGSAFVPQAEPSLPAGGAARLCLLLRSAPGEVESPDLEIEGRLREDGRPDWSPARISVVGRTSPDPTGLWKVLLEFAPGEHPPGLYRFAVTIREKRTRRSSVGETGFRISERALSAAPAVGSASETGR
jgi:VWFA-related protein